jgi:hypothetical protein
MVGVKIHKILNGNNRLKKRGKQGGPQKNRPLAIYPILHKKIKKVSSSTDYDQSRF